MKKLVIFGAAHAYSLQAIEAVNRATPTWEILGFLDDTPEKQGSEFFGYPILGGRGLLPELAKQPDVEFFNNVRGHWSRMETVTKLLDAHGCRIVSAAHPGVDLSHVEMGRGCAVSPGCVISVGTKLGDFVSVLANGVMGHDVVVEDYAFIAQLASLGSRCIVRQRAFCGAGAIIVPDRTLGRESTVGAGAVVTKDVPDGVTVFGMPARPRSKAPD